ncbi:MAG: ABC transporter ATP-binding protein [Novosphingobium sp.]|uniref:nickel ABC transporter ATP-binding protein NikE n=1 Tax=Novosphingobium sp. TaxID=1874826 RepID=UPI0012C39E1F|nr:ABC transporter ATP-binding protein [Novosphingobium sp.]MPS68880.1 ABC transporter ATP-binding protein [Novosphingobium sp.]
MIQQNNVVTFGPRAPVAPAAPLLSVRGLTIAGADGRMLVRGVDFEIPRGGTLGIVGESGSGKSLTCRAVLGVLPAGTAVTSGTIRYRDTDLSRLSGRDWKPLRGTELSAVFQDAGSYLNPSIPVGRQIVEAMRAVLPLSRREAKERALALLARVGFAEPETVFRQYPFELSGGMVQRVLIAIAVCAGPRLLIADEATTALDVTVQAEVLRLIEDLRREQDLTLVMVSHDLAVVAQTCDQVIVMREGEIVEAGATREVLDRPRHAYTRSLIETHHATSLEAGQNAPRPQAAAPLLRISGLRAGYGQGTVLDGIDLELARGEILGLIGETGSGKTTLLRSILGLVRPAEGTIVLGGEPLERLAGRELMAFRRSSRLQYAFQDPLRSLDPDITIAGSVGEGLDIRGDIDRIERSRLVNAALEAAGLDPALGCRLPRHLSGGQRQRAVIARALVLDPQVILLDEPVSALDAVNRIHVLQLLERLARERGIAQIFISHDLGSVAGIAHRVAVLHRGRIVETGPTGQVLSHPSHPYTRALIAAAPKLAEAGTGGALRLSPNSL